MHDTYYIILSVALMLKSTKIHNPTFAIIKSSNLYNMYIVYALHNIDFFWDPMFYSS